MSRQSRPMQSDESHHGDSSGSNPRSQMYSYSSMSESVYDGKTLKQRGFEDEFVDDGQPKHTRTYRRHFKAGDLVEDECIDIDLQSKEAQYKAKRMIKDQVVETCKKGQFSGDIQAIEGDPLQRISFDSEQPENVKAHNVDDPHSFQSRFEEQKRLCARDQSGTQTQWQSSGDQGKITHRQSDRD